MFLRRQFRGFKAFEALPAAYKEFIQVSLIIMLLTAAFFARPILFNLAPFPSDLLSYWPMFHAEGLPIQNMNFADVVVQYYPYYIFNYNSLHNLQLPLWNPYGAGGVPHLANMQSSIFYVLAWPVYLFGFTGFSLLAMYSAKFFLAGISSYYYLRSLKLRFSPALTGAIGFMFFNFYIVWFHWPIVDFLFILPASFYIIERLVSDGARGLRYYLAIAVLTAVCMFSCNPDGYAYLLVFAAAYFLFRARAGRLRIPDAFDIVKNAAAFSILGVGLSSIQLLPFVEYLLNSYAWADRTAGVANYLPWQAMIMNLMPDYYGTGALYLKTPFYADFTLYQSSAGYAGITLACLAVFAVLAKYRDRLVAYYLLTTVWATGVIYHAPLIYDITTRLPPFSLLYNSRLLFLLGFNTIVLGSIGLNEILDKLSDKADANLAKKILASCLLVLLAFLFLAYANGPFLETHYYFREGVGLIQAISIAVTCALILATFLILYYLAKPGRMRKLAVISLIILLFLETGGHAMLYLPSVSQDTLSDGNDPFNLIDGPGNLDRATCIDPVNHLSVYPVNIQMIYGVYDIRNYDAIEVDLYKRLLEACTNHTLSGKDLDGVNKNFLDFMGVRWVYSGVDLSEYPGFNRTGLKLVKSYPGYYLLENGGALPRAFMAYSAAFSTNGSSMLARLSDPSADWTAPLLVYGDEKTIEYPGGTSTVTVTGYEPTDVRIQVNASSPGFLVLTDTYYPGWNAYVDGKKAEILRADYAFRAVHLGPGTHAVEFKYQPLSFYAGALVSGLSLIALLAVALVAYRRKDKVP